LAVVFVVVVQVRALMLRTPDFSVVPGRARAAWPVVLTIRALPALAQGRAVGGHVAWTLGMESDTFLLRCLPVVVMSVNVQLEVTNHLLNVVLVLLAVGAAAVLGWALLHFPPGSLHV
jgi:hypothetical protein